MNPANFTLVWQNWPVEGDTFFLEQLSYVVNMLLLVAVEREDIINDLAHIFRASECFVHAVGVILADGGYPIRCLQELETPKRRDNHGDLLAIFIEWTLVVSFECIKHREETWCDVSYRFCRCQGYRSCLTNLFSLDRSTHMRILLWCHHDGCTPFGGFS